MTCAENRERHSALLDGELPATERARVEVHLAECAECSAELARLARMLGMLHALPAERAPLGFVDRVLAAARPAPWYVRAWRGLTQPWRLKLPLEAAAVVIVALGVVYVFQKTPELQQAARHEAPAPSPPAQESSRTEPSAPAPAAAPPSSAPSRDANRAESSKLESSAKLKSAPMRPPAEEAAKPSSAVAPLSKESDAKEKSDMKDKAAATREADSLGEKKTGGARMDAQSPPAAPAPQYAPTTQSEPRRQRLGGAAPAAPEDVRAFAPPDASGRLTVGDREAAERPLAELRGRLGVTEAFRRDAGDGNVVIEMIVPRAALADFTRGLDGIGRWTWDRDPSTLPAQIRLQILLAR